MRGAEELVKIRAHSPGRYPILIVETPDGGLCAAYLETGYDLGRAKPVEEDWLHENAVGRHSFIEVNPPKELAASALEDHARQEIIGRD
ncbi:MAG TPA: hypothetical protein VK869_13215 [Rubrobacteraceae bacterium]|nr:hypothetical protein [Rubrobacteraceae bacterium]